MDQHCLSMSKTLPNTCVPWKCCGKQLTSLCSGSFHAAKAENGVNILQQRIVCSEGLLWVADDFELMLLSTLLCAAILALLRVLMMCSVTVPHAPLCELMQEAFSNDAH